MTTLPNILLTNDDGIYAAGIRHLYESLKGIANLTVVAPTTEQSGRALGITIYRPVRVHEVPWDTDCVAYAVEGTPVDCVKMALSKICTERPDMVLAGINAGSNAGRNLLYSGTVGTVIEGALKGLQGVAFSCLDHNEPTYEWVTPYIPKIVAHLQQQPLPEGTILNINFPSRSHGECKGIRMARQGRGFWTDAPMERLDHNGIPYYWLGGRNVVDNEHPESDVALLEQGFAAAVPVQVKEFTDLTELHARQDAFEGFSTIGAT